MKEIEGVSINGIVYKDLFYAKALHAALKYHDNLTIDFWGRLSNNNMVEMTRYSKGTWLNKWLYKKSSYILNNENRDIIFDLTKNDIHRINWGIRHENESIIFSGYFYKYIIVSRTKFFTIDKITEFVNILKRDKIIAGIEYLYKE
jgi:hypothetical protein